MKVGEVARRASLSTATVRYYEDIGLMPPPPRTPNGYRDYPAKAIERLRFIREAQESGLALAEITSILELRGQGQPTCHHVVDLLERHLQDVDRRIESLRASRDLYAGLIERARTLEPADCTDPDRCQTISIELSGIIARPEGARPRWRRRKHRRVVTMVRRDRS